MAVTWIAFVAALPALLTLLQKSIHGLTHKDLNILSQVVGHFQNNANSFLLWGVVLSSYLLPTCLTILLLASLRPIGSDRKLGAGKLSIYFLFGLLIGGSGYVIAFSAFVYIFLTKVAQKIRSKDFRNFDIRIVLHLVGILTGVSISFFAPGTQLRREVLLGSGRNFGHLVLYLPLDYFRLFIEIFINPGIIVVFAIALLTAKSWITKGAFKASETFIHLLGKITLILFVVIPIGEMFSYKAFWHKAPVQITLFLYVFALGIKSGQSKDESKSNFLVSTILIISVVMSFNYYGSQIDNWRIQSLAGEDLGGLSGYKNSNWIADCRNRVINARGGER